RETVRKVARTTASMTALIDETDDFLYGMSSAQQYAWVKEHQPELYDRIRRAVAAGQWVPVGGMWVESDTNLPGGEALARQLVHGKRFFLDEFGVECEEVWLPDSFGYTGAFPQLARLAGCRWFLTQKMSWNQTNKIPHHTFWWEGIDGTRVFTHLPPADTYSASLTGKELTYTVRNFAEKGAATRSLVPFGHGDGGGGPTREMVERARRWRDLEGAPRLTIESPAAFFAAAEAEYPDAPVWSGELYFEMHRGVYTTQAKTKRGNRRGEHLLREAELWAVAAAVHAGADYPYQELDRLWKILLLHQFHDILPGSSIAWVHREAEATYARLAADIEAVIADALAALGGADAGRGVFNAGPYPRDEVVVVDPADAGTDPAGQRLTDGRVAVPVSVPALGAGGLSVAAASSVTVSGRTLDNGLLRVTVDDDGLLTSVYDLVAGREALAPGGRGNLLQLHPDHPNRWDAWDLDQHYRRTVTDLTSADEVTVVDSGPLLAAVRVTRSFGESRVTQTVSLRAGSRRVDVDTEIDWHEREKVLKAAFPLDVHAERATSETQFGHVHRATHRNTSWDAARFETCAHRWLHVGEAGYGVAVVNDSTYGHDVTRGSVDSADPGRPTGTTTTVRLTLLRAPRFPDPVADQGRHRFRYALVPGATIADAVAEGYATNLPLRVGPLVSAPPVVTVTHPAVVVEAVKLADDGSGDVVVRLYEAYGGRATTRLETAFPVADAHVTDLLERPLGPARLAELTLRPFQVLTLRLRRG
ncbi:MAG TPA: glycoside hydrolase family 38 C-terminal domain-containing protein, partial [Micromonospora sp.]